MPNLREIEKQARAALAPLRLPKSLKGLEKAKARWEIQLRISFMARDQIQLSNPDGCDTPIEPGDDFYIDIMWAETQAEVCRENIRAINDRIQFLEAVAPAGVPVSKHYDKPRPWRPLTALSAVAVSPREPNVKIEVN